MCERRSVRSRALAFRRTFGAHQQWIGAPMRAIGSREIAAGVEPAHWNRKAAARPRSPAHDVSILLGAGRQLGSQPRLNLSMMRMRPPQQGHGGLSVSLASLLPALAAAETLGMPKSLRAVAMYSALPVPAKSP